jgi:hypothetical protein
LAKLPSIIPQLAVLATCIFYLVKKGSIDGILLTIGSFIGNAISIFYLFIWQQLMTGGNTDALKAIGPIGIIGSLTFVIGFIILIGNTVKRNDNSALDS